MDKNIFIQNKEEIFFSVEKAYKTPNEKIISLLKKSDIKGMGGAGFPTWIKWQAVKNISSPIKYVIANGHEGEPFTLKDKFLMNNFPHLIIAGVLIAAKLISSKNIFIVINKDYKEEYLKLKKAVKDFSENSFLCSINIQIIKAKKRYIGGEESALLNELEGKRIEPRNKIPLVCNSGLNCAPTLINNIETFAQIPFLILNGIFNYKKNTIKLFTISGDVKYPGVYFSKLGCRINDLIKLAGGFSGKPKFAIIGGYSGVTVLPEDFNKKINFNNKPDEIYLGAGTVIIFNQKTKALDVLKSLFNFYKAESCGKCVPCREGTQRLYEIIIKSKDKISINDKQKIDELIFTMNNSSFCAFGPCVGMAAKGIFENFGKEIISE